MTSYYKYMSTRVIKKNDQSRKKKDRYDQNRY